MKNMKQWDFSKIPAEIRTWVENQPYRLDQVGCAASKVIFYANNLVLKVDTVNEESNNEIVMTKWLFGKLPVPKVIGSSQADGYNYLLSQKLDGKMAIDDFYLSRPEQLVRLLAQGLKRLWKVDITDCPYRNDVANKLRLAKILIQNGQIDINDAEPGTFGIWGFPDPLALYEYLDANRPEEELVFSHGDYCLPNIFFSKNEISGFLDLGRSGIADRWQDIALCVRSLRHNLKTDAYRERFFQELGIEPNEEKIRYFVLLDELF